MASPARVRANRANSARSTGPRTAKGRAASSANSLRHGLTSQQIVIGDEVAADFQALVADLMTSHQPANAAEAILVGQIAENYWRLLRARKIETGYWERKITENNGVVAHHERFQHETSNQQNADIFGWDKDGMFQKLMRYEASIERSYYRAIKQLEHLQATRKKEEKPIGFVSQKRAAASSGRPAAVAIMPSPAENPPCRDHQGVSHHGSADRTGLPVGPAIE